MKLRYHAIPRDLFDALAAGGGGPEAIRVLAAAEQSKHGALLRGVLAEAAKVGDATQARYASIGREVLSEVERLDRGAAERVTSYPAVGAWATSTLRALQTNSWAPRRRTRETDHRRGRSRDPVRARRRSACGAGRRRRLVALAWCCTSRHRFGRRTQYPGSAVVRWAHGRVEIPPEGVHHAPGWLGIRDCHAGDLAAVIEDLDPFRMPAEAGDLAPRLTVRQARGWQRVTPAGLGSPRDRASRGRRGGRRRDFCHRPAAQVGARPPQFQRSRHLRGAGDVEASGSRDLRVHLYP